MTAVHLRDVDPAEGCTTCGSPATVRLSPYRGRLCSDHVTLPPGPYDRALAADMVLVGRADAALAYLRAVLARDCDERFRVAAERLGAA